MQMPPAQSPAPLVPGDALAMLFEGVQMLLGFGHPGARGTCEEFTCIGQIFVHGRAGFIIHADIVVRLGRPIFRCQMVEGEGPLEIRRDEDVGRVVAPASRVFYDAAFIGIAETEQCLAIVATGGLGALVWGAGFG